ncbi:hypothetical protein, partial [Plasmodium yoelii yoelii]
MLTNCLFGSNFCTIFMLWVMVMFMYPQLG